MPDIIEQDEEHLPRKETQTWWSTPSFRQVFADAAAG
jgi:hypothetical protein